MISAVFSLATLILATGTVSTTFLYMEAYTDSEASEQCTSKFWEPSAKKKAKSSGSQDEGPVAEDCLSFAMRGAIQSASFKLASVKLPWEKGYVAKVLGNGKISVPTLNLSATSIPPIPKEAEPQIRDTYVFPAQTNFTAKARLRGLKDVPTEDALRNRAVTKWRCLLEMDLEATDIGSQILSLLVSLADVSEVSSLLSDVLNCKATSTLSKRVGPLLQFVYWGKRFHVIRPLLFEEEHVYAYLKAQRKLGCAPTWPWGFIRAVSFFGHTFGSLGAKESSKSPRIVGLCDSEYVKKKPLKQKRPLKVQEVMILENLAWMAPDCQDRVAAGQFAFDVYASARFSDPKYAEYLKLEVDDKFEGFAELGTKGHKTATTIQKKTMFLPLIAQTRCLLDKPWAQGWIRAREATDLEFGKGPSLPAPSMVSNSWLQRPLTAAEGTQWLKELLVMGGCKLEEVKDIGTHSLKVTALSWAAKYGLDVQTRRLLGHHSDPQMRSILTYSRDAMSGPLAKLGEIIDAIRNKTFCPDLPRHQRFPKPSRSESNAGEAVPLLELDSWEELGEQDVKDLTAEGERLRNPTAVQGEVVEFSCAAKSDDEGEDLVGMSGDESSDSSEDLSDSEMRSPRGDDALLTDATDVQRAVHDNFDHVKYSVFQHRSSGVLHIRSSVVTKFLCGRIITAFYTIVKDPLAFQWPNCQQCNHRLDSDDAFPTSVTDLEL